MKLIDVLQKMKVNELKKEISKQNIRGYSKLKKAEIIKIMTDRHDKFKYLLLQNMQQKKELLQDKVKLKDAKEKMKKMIAKKIPAKKAQQAEVIKPKPKKQPLIPKIIKTKTGVVTVKPKKELTKDELKLMNLEKELKKLENKNESLENSRKNIDKKLNLESQIMQIKLSIFELKDKLKGVSEKKAIENKKKAIREFKENVQDFIKKPSDELLEKIEKNIELMDELPEKLEDKLDKAIEKFENKDKKKVEPKKDKKKEEPKKMILGQQKQFSEDALKKLGYTIMKKATPKPAPAPKPAVKKQLFLDDDTLSKMSNSQIENYAHKIKYTQRGEYERLMDVIFNRFIKAPKKKQVDKKTEEPDKAPKKDEAKEYIKKILKTNKKIRLFNKKNLEKKLNEKNIDVTRINQIIDSKIEDEIELFSKTEIISDKDIDVFKKGSGKLKDRMFNIINDLEKLIFNKKTTKPAVDFINFLNNETNKREKLYIAVKIQQSFDKYCNKLDQLEDFIKIIKPNNYKNKLERIKFLDERCLDLIDIIDDLQDKFNITSKQIKDNELMIF